MSSGFSSKLFGISDVSRRSQLRRIVLLSVLAGRLARVFFKQVAEMAGGTKNRNTQRSGTR